MFLPPCKRVNKLGNAICRATTSEDLKGRYVMYLICVIILLVVFICALGGDYTQSNRVTPGQHDVRVEARSPMDDFPDLEIFVRMFNGKRRFYDTVLAKSLRLFWPRPMLKMVAVLDNESSVDHEWATQVRNNYPYPRVMYENPTPYYHDHGHTRQQYTVFHADKYTDAEYVGFVDTDTFFVTPVTPEILFEDGKPIVIGGTGEEDMAYWKGIPSNTAEWLKSKEVMKCMTYFPVIVKVKHIKEMRNLIEDIHDAPFDEIFKKLTPTLKFCQFNIMCQYIWHYHRDDYKFHIQPYPGPKYELKNVPKGRVPPEYYKTHVTPEEWTPMPRSSIHWHYPSTKPAPQRKMPKSQERLILDEAFCLSLGFKYCKHKCNTFDEDKIQTSLYMFEGAHWTWHPLALQRQREHYDRVHGMMEYLNRTRQSVFGAASIEDACERWPDGYNLTHFLDK